MQDVTWRYYDWRKRYKAEGMEDLKNHKSTPASYPHSLLGEEKQAIINYVLKHPDLRHRKLAKKMIDDHIVYVSASSTYRVLKDDGLIPEQSITKIKMQTVKLKLFSQTKSGLPILVISL